MITQINSMDNSLLVNTNRIFVHDPSNTNTSKRLKLNFTTLKQFQEKEEKGNKIYSQKKVGKCTARIR